MKSSYYVIERNNIIDIFLYFGNFHSSNGLSHQILVIDFAKDRQNVKLRNSEQLRYSQKNRNWQNNQYRFLIDCRFNFLKEFWKFLYHVIRLVQKSLNEFLVFKGSVESGPNEQALGGRSPLGSKCLGRTARLTATSSTRERPVIFWRTATSQISERPLYK